MHLVKVEFPQNCIGVMDITQICNLDTVAEKPYPRKGTSQCHRCQQFRHSSRNCTANARCVKCAGNHKSDECPRPDHSEDIPPTCVNCGGNHTANYRGCKSFPSGKNKGTKPRNTPASTPISNSASQPPTAQNNLAKMFNDFLAWARINQPSLLETHGH